MRNNFYTIPLLVENHSADDPHSFFSFMILRNVSFRSTEGETLHFQTVSWMLRVQTFMAWNDKTVFCARWLSRYSRSKPISERSLLKIYFRARTHTSKGQVLVKVYLSSTHPWNEKSYTVDREKDE